MTAQLKPIPITDPNIAQRAASNPVASAWVNASAGSGKTSVLTARVTRLLLAGVPPEKILCLTYTRAGAAEMANRVTTRLSKWAVCDDNELSKDLSELQNEAPKSRQMTEARRLFARVLSCPGGLRIRTIHSFCQEILSRFPIEAGLPPHFALIDEQELEILRNDVLDGLLREAGENPQSALAKSLSVLVAAQGEHGFDKMLQEVMQARATLSDAIKQAGSEDDLIASTRHFLELQPNDTADKFRRAMMDNLAEDKLRQLAKWLLDSTTATHSARGQNLANILAAPAADRTHLFDDYCAIFMTKDGDPRKQLADKKTLAAHPEIEEISLREMARLQSTLERIEACAIADMTAAVLSFGGAFAARLAERKAQRAALDYDDLIQFTEKLLNRPGIAPWILYKLDNGIDHILVDEAQDTSRAQWAIVQSLTAEFYAGKTAREQNRTLFVVGDEKQSIFSFQNADPDAFLSLRDTFATRLRDADKKLDIVPMHTSFRSARAILHAVDVIFARAEAHSGVSPDPIHHAAFKSAADMPGRVEIWPLFKPVKDTDEKENWPLPKPHEEEQDPQAELAHAIATKIKNWLTQKEILPGTNRPIEPNDIMILLRRRGRFADLMVRALKAQRVQVTGVDRMHLIKQLPVMDLLAVIRFVLLPEDDLNLATLLRSPLLGLSEEDLMLLAIGRKESLWHSLKAAPAHKTIADYLTAKLAEADYSTPFAFLSTILSAPCPAGSISGRRALWSRLGDESLDPVEELLNEAQSFGISRAPSLQNFLHWLTQADFEIKRELDNGKKQGGGQVRIMTVHASKGLEAPIVFLPDTVAMPQSQAVPQFQWSDGAPLFLTHQPAFGAAQRVWNSARNRQLQEYRRLFYVALTRSATWLFIGGWLDKRSHDAPDDSWYGLARAALQPLHQPHAVGDSGADIVFADAAPPTPLAQKKTASLSAPVALPAWATQKIAATDFIPITKKDLPAATPDSHFTRGRLIHRMLQSLPDITPSLRDAAIKRFLAQPRHNLTASQQNEIAQEITRLSTDKTFADLFSPDGLAEAPLTGSIDGKTVFRQVDRLILRDDEVWIVDYKTNRPPPDNERDIPPAYREQMNEYRLLLRGIYPNKRVRCFLLWTYAPRLMEINHR